MVQTFFLLNLFFGGRECHLEIYDIFFWHQNGRSLKFCLLENKHCRVGDLMGAECLLILKNPHFEVFLVKNKGKNTVEDWTWLALMKFIQSFNIPLRCTLGKVPLSYLIIFCKKCFFFKFWQNLEKVTSSFFCLSVS